METLRAKLADLKEHDSFAALGVKSQATPAEVRSAFLTLAKQWHPNVFGLEPAEIRAVVAEIFIVLRRAHDTLVDPDTAATYRTRVAKSSPPNPPSKAPNRAESPRPSDRRGLSKRAG